ncbi:hypothetical protein C731_1995 [Mycolicibacterium hassiacum DSM 44199]|uniref:Uncharacterized protein n=3 Tax=Mycolicibacterium hassiacum TaxID=46351 RepID=K5BBH0_MYCHD|nr:hypothetical protein [Mycolicibacterium hassiacum]EKF23975.1 hypothetical protein C731_1995 [Mycolicibacterium hassiacum DSM 44199]
MTPPGLLRTTQGAVSSVTGVLPPAPAPAPGASGSLAAGIPAGDQVTGPIATGISNLVAPPALALPDIPGLPVPLPNGIPMPTDLICEGTDWSTSRTPAAEIPAPAGDRRDRWED